MIGHHRFVVVADIQLDHPGKGAPGNHHFVESSESPLFSSPVHGYIQHHPQFFRIPSFNQRRQLTQLIQFQSRHKSKVAAVDPQHRAAAIRGSFGCMYDGAVASQGYRHIGLQQHFIRVCRRELAGNGGKKQFRTQFLQRPADLVQSSGNPRCLAVGNYRHAHNAFSPFTLLNH